MDICLLSMFASIEIYIFRFRRNICIVVPKRACQHQVGTVTVAWNFFWLRTKSGFGCPSLLKRQSRNRLSPNPSREVAFRKRAGIIWSVSTFSSGSGTQVEVSILNFSFISVIKCGCYNKSRGSVMTPVTAAAAATSGPARIVRAPGP